MQFNDKIADIGTNDYHVCFGGTPKPTTTRFGMKNPQTVSCRRCKPSSDILDRFGVAHWCDGQTDRQTELRWR